MVLEGAEIHLLAYIDSVIRREISNKLINNVTKEHYERTYNTIG